MSNGMSVMINKPMGFRLNVGYQSVRDVQQRHPYIKEMQAIYRMPKNMSTEWVINKLQEKGVQGELYKVGWVIWKVTQTRAGNNANP